MTDNSRFPPVEGVVSVKRTDEVTVETSALMIVKRVKLFTMCIIIPGRRLPK